MIINEMKEVLINKCASVLGIRSETVAKMLEMNSATNMFIDRRIAYGFINPNENLGYLLRGILSRRLDDFSEVRDSEVSYIEKVYKIKVKFVPSENIDLEMLSERKTPLQLGILGEKLLREYSKVLGITRRDAIKIIKCNEQAKSFLQREKNIKLIEEKRCLSTLLKGTFLRDNDDFSPIKDTELYLLNRKYGLEIEPINVNKPRRIVG